jgi:hypothetical protein
MASMGVRPNAKAKVVGVLLLLVALAAIYWVMLETGALTTVTNKAALSEWIDQLGEMTACWLRMTRCRVSSGTPIK